MDLKSTLCITLIFLCSNYSYSTVSCSGSDDLTLIIQSSQRKPVVIIVDAYDSASLLAIQFSKHDISVVHLKSTFEIHPRLRPSYRPQDFEHVITYEGNYEELLIAIRSFKPLAIIPGKESGVLLANQLSASLASELDLPTNSGIKKTRNPYAVFRDKFLMHEQLKEHSPQIRYMRQIASNSANHIIDWVKQNNFFNTGTRKIVVKPRGSAGSEGVYICNTQKEIREAVRSIKNIKKSDFGLNTSEIVAQEYIQGTEYVVNAVSRGGKHIITDMWQYNKRIPKSGIGILYDNDDLLPFRGEAQDQIRPYAVQALNALGLQFGFSHTEIFIDDKGPVLVETANRMMGSMQPALAELGILESPLQIGVEAIAFPDKFLDHKSGYTIKQHVMLIELSSNRNGAFINPAFVNNLTQLPGYHEHTFGFGINKPTVKSTNMANMLGKVLLMHPDPETINTSLYHLRSWEQNGDFFKK